MNQSMRCMHLVPAVFQESRKSLLRLKNSLLWDEGQIGLGKCPSPPPTKKPQNPKQKKPPTTKKSNQTKKPPKLIIVLESVYPAYAAWKEEVQSREDLWVCCIDLYHVAKAGCQHRKCLWQKENKIAGQQLLIFMHPYWYNLMWAKKRKFFFFSITLLDFSVHIWEFVLLMCGLEDKHIPNKVELGKALFLLRPVLPSRTTSCWE